MNQEFDENDIPNENQIYSSFQSQNDISKISFLSNHQSKYEDQHIIYLFKYFMEFQISKLDIQYMNIYGTCLSKFTNQLKTNNPHLITKILSHLRNQLQKIIFLTELHVAFLQSCIMSYNYKIGYQFTKSKIFLQESLDKKNQIIIEYFYYAGLIANAQKDYDEALRCYKIAYKMQPTSVFTFEAQKLESLLCFRLGLELKNWPNPQNSILVSKLKNIIESQGFKNLGERENDLQDQNINICLKEWSIQAQLYQFLQKEQELHSKVHFDLINHNFHFFDYETLIGLLMNINNVHNMFSINEEKKYLEFKYNNLTYKEINSKLENRYDLLKSLSQKK
ncbi:unnamed protein product [Paramecium pentaurelia]|uniref:COP9 signalosome complex subunit 3 N-terminal helical repeats domain-containing protein n=1 Tax=Paramecium pentaurelia TaxID=43138 RepID=A0A8S1VIB5_9CILI|nr:unnamed protein product [Paramecium pentaurelia]